MAAPFVETRVDLGGLAGKVSFTQRDIDRHAVVDEARAGNLHQIERARLSQAVEVPCEFAAVRSESNDFIVTHVDPLGFVVDGDRAVGGGRLGRLAEKVGGFQRGARGQARRGKGQYSNTAEERLHVILHFDGWDKCPIGAAEMSRVESTTCKTWTAAALFQNSRNFASRQDRRGAWRQAILPNEIAPTHRHAPNALRFILEGEGAYTAVDGERVTMRPGDFVVTPGWTW